MVVSVATSERRASGTEELQWRHLIEGVARADQDALGQLYDGTCRIVFSLILRIVEDRSTAEEVTLDVYKQVWRQAGNYDSARSSPVGWLLMLARSRALDAMRSRVWKEQEQNQPLDSVTALNDLSAGPEDTAVLAQRSHLVRTALVSLLPEQREAIELAFFTGLSHTEIAAQTGVPLGTVKTRIRTGMLKMRAFLQPLGGGIQ